MNSRHLLLAVVVFMGVELAYAQNVNVRPKTGLPGPFYATGPAGILDPDDDWDVTPITGLEGPFDARGRDGKPNTADVFDGVRNSPDARGPDKIPGTKDDLPVYIWGTGGGKGGCFNDDEPNCAGARGAKSAKWSVTQVVDAGNCKVHSTLTNESDDTDPQCPQPGCISAWSSPRLPKLQEAVEAKLPIGPGESVGPIADGPDPPPPPCFITQVNHNMKWNPVTPLALLLNFDGAQNIGMINSEDNSLWHYDGRQGSHLLPGGGNLGPLVPPGKGSNLQDVTFNNEGDPLLLEPGRVRRVDKFGSVSAYGNTEDHLTQAQRMACLSNGDLAVTDASGSCVKIFDSEGTYRRALAGPLMTNPILVADNPTTPYFLGIIYNSTQKRHPCLL